MKKAISIILAALLLMGSLCACAAGRSGAEEAPRKLRIVTTIFPEYDWVMNVLGACADEAEVTLLLGRGVDLHSYQPSVEDITKISGCDLLIYVGGESDRWVKDALAEARNKEMTVLSLLDLLGEAVKEEERTEGMQEEQHGQGHEEEHEDHGQGQDACETEYDEHVWLSLRYAALLVGRISEALQALDAPHAEAYRANAEAYAAKLAALDGEYRAAAGEASVTTLVFGDRFPFRYLTDDYGLRYYAAFPGCSAETEASFETVTFLAGKVDELGLKAVLTIEGKDHRIAETIVQNTRTGDQRILTMDSMQATTAGDVKNGVTYLSIMESNLSVLKEALS